MSSTQPEIIVYATKTCPFCTMAKSLLDGKGLKYDLINVGTDRSMWQAMQEKSGRNTVPQVFVGDHHVGGFDELSAADRSGELDQILAK
ncbi:glutaredoxin 3 [Hydrogenovibrio sp. 3SP14C1]|uniref:glutaredoxin 3 n=1 Tax=Hydrogenovibrio sp. 3SP14C1 TaxID=3038774 RepID=UPI0024165912|nr:glutaredoxin 3 [Hydrogenovibrio sp. 3SP14C1]MDG4811379.1 glutaredoxin 3 [Hydrogenovibrio sp. 3SP14C1]